MLSQRLLIFTPNAVFWDCQCATWREDSNWEMAELGENVAERYAYRFAKDHYSDYRKSLGNGAYSDDLYWNSVGDFSGRHLTHQSDALAAFTGILSTMEHTKTVSFTWALLKNILSVAIDWLGISMWNTTDSLRRRDALCPIQVGGKIVRVPFPSWFWVGWEGKLRRGAPLREQISAVRLRFYMFSEVGILKSIPRTAIQPQYSYRGKMTHGVKSQPRM